MDVLKYDHYIFKEWKARTNFNILTDRAPTPNFSITYIETSVSACDETGKTSHYVVLEGKNSAQIVLHFVRKQLYCS